MRLLIILPVILATTMMFSACINAKEGQLEGCYALENGGPAELKVTKADGKYYVSLREGGGWSKPEGLHSGSPEEMMPLFGDDSGRIKANLVADDGPFGIFLVNPGELYGGEKAETEYLAFVIFGGGSVYKVSCK